MAPGMKGDSRDSALSSSSTEGDTIKVYLRVRPPDGTVPADGNHGLCLSVLSSNTIHLHSKPEPKIFTFDHVADMDTTQESVFSSVARNIVESCMNGYNGTIFAYGQTGSGKTFTMMGPPDSDNFTHNLRGVIPRSFEYLFFLIDREKEKAGTGKNFLCKCSFIEIYNEQIYDLLDSASAGLLLREHITKGVFVDGAVEQVLSSATEAYQMLTVGWRNRRVAATSMNRESSRSHAVFTITVESVEKSNEVVNIRSSQLNLVDLAGSERQKDTHTEGVRLKEAGNINRSLSCLGKVITALVDVSNGKQRHVCYRESKLTFLLRDSLGGNAKTCIIANIHPGSRYFGETLSTLNFAQRAKLIKNKAVVNEDTQGNVKQLQTELKKLKEQLALLTSGRSLHDVSLPIGTLTHEVGKMDYMNSFLEAMLFLEKSESERKVLLDKVAQLEDLCVKKEKFIQSNKMIIKFREDYITRLEKLHKEAYGNFLPKEQEEIFRELKEELKTLREQVEHHPRVVKYAMENHSLREENKRLRSLQSVKRVQEMDAQAMVELEKAFLEASRKECQNGGQQLCPTVMSTDNCAASVEKLKERLLHMQRELANSQQEYEEFKALTKKKSRELELEVQSLQTANQHLERILEATKACKRQEVSHLNKIHMETIKNITTPTKAIQLRSRLVARLSPETLSQNSIDTQSSGEMDGILNEPVPAEMNEQAYEAIAEELRLVQEQLSTCQVKLDEEESKNVKLQQHVYKLESHCTQIQELFSSGRNEWQTEKQNLLEQINALEKQHQDTQCKADILKSEVHDLRIVLQSADKELSSIKTEYDAFREKQEKELSELSLRHMNVQLQLDSVRLEYEKVLEGKTSLQDDYDNLQEILKFETDQLTQQLVESKQESEVQKSAFQNLLLLLESEKEHNQKLTMQLQEDKEHSSQELLKASKTIDPEKPPCEMMPRYEQQEIKLQKLQQDLTAAEELTASLRITNAADKEVVTDLMSQIQKMRMSINQKTEYIEGLTRELEDLNYKYNSALAMKEENKAIIETQERQIEELREAIERVQIADKIEKELLCEDLNHTSEQLSKLTEASEKYAALLQCAQEDMIKKEAIIQELKAQLLKKSEELASCKSECEFKIQQAECFRDSAVAVSQSPKTPPNLDAYLAKHLETQEQEILDRRASAVTLECLVAELNEERDAKNCEILRLKTQLCELENTRLEMQTLMENNRNLQSQLEESRRGKRIGSPRHQDVQNPEEKEKEMNRERIAKTKAMEEMLAVRSELEKNRRELKSKNTAFQEITLEVERTRALELKAFQEKEEMRSKLEEMYEERVKMEKEMSLLRKQVESLAEENGKLVGHQNLNQKIQYLVKLKKEHARLIEEADALRAENAFLKEKGECGKTHPD
ncbi:kinesin-like protein KIF15 isoform X1 [Sphaerodactylus townsendi]|uniref:kinesin-like protein KIF15 isoform X1 n=2 Tax=Sphaerodactylus townsendi TaxID=933632 RepID=UPI00202746F3|nr:kinesin-like protein KIF15 isoform X1 [Sphaerodactylus townsendi]